MFGVGERAGFLFRGKLLSRRQEGGLWCQAAQKNNGHTGRQADAALPGSTLEYSNKEMDLMCGSYRMS
jgi:hypothetical protein